MQTSLYSFLKCWKVQPANVYVTLTILLWAIGHWWSILAMEHWYDITNLRAPLHMSGLRLRFKMRPLIQYPKGYNKCFKKYQLWMYTYAYRKLAWCWTFLIGNEYNWEHPDMEYSSILTVQDCVNIFGNV